MTTMRAVVITSPGGPEVLQIEERPAPEPSRGEIRVRDRNGGRSPDSGRSQRVIAQAFRLRRDAAEGIVRRAGCRATGARSRQTGDENDEEGEQTSHAHP